MKTEGLWEQFSALPPAARQQVADFIAFLQTRHSKPKPAGRRKSPRAIAETSDPPSRSRSSLPRNGGKRRALAKEPFIGMWADRDDMQDASAWVRAVREREWAGRHG